MTHADNRGRERAPDGPTSLLRGLWYYALPGHRLRPGRMLHRTLLGEPVLIGREPGGAVFALRDICPHRGIPLSYGSLEGGEVVCCYHGWRCSVRRPCSRRG